MTNFNLEVLNLLVPLCGCLLYCRKSLIKYHKTFVSRILQVVRVSRKSPLQMGVSRVLQQKNPEGWNPETNTSADSVTCGEKKINHLLFLFSMPSQKRGNPTFRHGWGL